MSLVLSIFCLFFSYIFIRLGFFIINKDTIISVTHSIENDKEIENNFDSDEINYFTKFAFRFIFGVLFIVSIMFLLTSLYLVYQNYA